MNERNAVVGICDSLAEAEAGVKAFEGTGFDMGKLSVAGKEGAFRDGLRSRLSGPAPFVIPGIGPLIVYGPLADWIAGALESGIAIGDLSTLGLALYDVGIPENAIIRYEAALKSGRFLFIAHGTAEETAQAQDVLEATVASRIDIHPYFRTDAPAPKVE
jgi:hypothetical protein